MYTHLQERKFYEDIYDKFTVEAARRGMGYYDDFYADFKNKLPKGEKIDKPGNAFVLNVFYMQTVGNELIRRYQQRDEKIRDWMARDEAEDNQIY